MGSCHEKADVTEDSMECYPKVPGYRTGIVSQAFNFLIYNKKILIQIHRDNKIWRQKEMTDSRSR